MNDHHLLIDFMNNFFILKKTIIENALCTRCGMCAGVCPEKAITPDEDAYPILTGKCIQCGLCVQCCPGGEFDFPAMSQAIFNKEYDPQSPHGHVEEMVIAHAKDQAVRAGGASGGVVTALLIYLLEQKFIDGAVVIGMDKKHPCQTKGILATTPEEIRAASQSKYCITPSLEVLNQIREQDGKFAVVGLPCQIHALRKLQFADTQLAEKIRYIFGLYCACNIEPHGHLEALSACNINLDDVVKFQFRGGAWPGGYYVEQKNGQKGRIHPLRNTSVLHVMFRIFGPERCRVCIDGLAEFADLSFGDFWAFDYDGPLAELERSTCVSVRTARGKQLVELAQEQNVLSVWPVDKEKQSKRIINMVWKKRFQAGKLISSRLKKGGAIPDYHFHIPRITPRTTLSSSVYQTLILFRGYWGRKLILKLMFSPLGLLYYKLQSKGKWRSH